MTLSAKEGPILIIPPQRDLAACGQRYYDITDPRNGEGDWITKLYWKHPVIENYQDNHIGAELAGLDPFWDASFR